MTLRTRVPANPGNYHKGRIKRIRLIVIHTGETNEGKTAAEGMGAWFANPRAKASGHVGADTDSICRYVADGDTAWCAPGMNADGLHLELAGRAGQTKGDWADAASKAILANGALAAAEWVIEHDIPMRWLTDDELRAGKRGFSCHAQGTRVYRGTHTDPGRNFPFEEFMRLVRAFVAALTKKPVAAPAKTPAKPAAKPALLDVDGSLGPKTIRRWQQVMGTEADGVISKPSALVRAVQKRLKVAQTGLLDKATIKALQRHLGTTPDGVISTPTSEMVKALQRRLNSGKF